MIAFYQVSFSSQTKNRIGEFIETATGPFSETVLKKSMESSLTIGELAKGMGASFRTFAKTKSQERN